MNKSIYSKQSDFLRTTLIQIRKDAGLTQRQLAERLGREHGLVGRLELGERRLDIVELFWLCKACDATPHAVAKALFKQFDDMLTGTEK